MLAASYAGCDGTLTVVLFTIAMGFMGTFYCGMKVNALDLSPNFAGTLMAIVNGIGAISGIITPYLIGALTEDVSSLLKSLLFIEKLTFCVLAHFITMEIGILDYPGSINCNKHCIRLIC